MDEGLTIEQIAERAETTPRRLHYLIQEGVLKGVGTPGPKARYPKSFLDRVLFIKRLHDEAGFDVPARVLSQVLDTTDEETITAIAAGTEPVRVVVMAGDSALPSKKRASAVPLAAVARMTARAPASTPAAGKPVERVASSRTAETVPHSIDAYLRQMLAEESSRLESRIGRLVKRRVQEALQDRPVAGEEVAPGVYVTIDPSRVKAAHDVLARIAAVISGMS